MIKIGGKTYDVSSYMYEHPGGKAVLEKYCGGDATRAFEEVGHSSEAFKIMERLVVQMDAVLPSGISLSPINKESSGAVEPNPSGAAEPNPSGAAELTPSGAAELYSPMSEPSNLVISMTNLESCSEKSTLEELMPEKFVLDNTVTHFGFPLTRILAKFFTKEDRFQVHDILGMFCLCHYFYRFVLLATRRKAFSERSTSLTLCAIWLHAVLSFSPFLFNIPGDKPMMWHNMLSSLRSILSITSSVLLTDTSDRRVKALTTLTTLLIGDLVTRKLGNKTTGTMPYLEECPKVFRSELKLYYSFSENGAAISCLGGVTPSFCVMFPAQFSSFLLTWVHKGHLNGRQFHLLYLLGLLVPQLLYMTDRSFHWKILPLAIMITLLRGFTSKYALWLSVLLPYLVGFDL